MLNNDKYNFCEFSSYSVNNSQLPHLWIAPDGKIIYANKMAEDLSEFSPLNDMFIYRISSDISKRDWRKLWITLLRNKTFVFSHKFYSKKNDIIFTLNIHCNYFNYDNSDYCQMVIVDNTELIETNQRLTKEKQKAKESEKLKYAFLSNMSHEIRTPMNAIVGFSDILYNISTDDDIRQYTSIIVQSADSLLSLIDNIITISRIDSEQIKVKSEPFNVNKLLNEDYITYTNKIKKTQKDIKLILKVDGNQIIESDPYLIQECINKLLDNAIKFTTSGTIEFGYSIKDEKITFFVKDTGIGIENKHQEIIFDRFRQINKQTEGSGLGLSIFSLFVKILNGTLDMKSTFNKGSYFSFTLNIRMKKQIVDVIEPSTIEKLKNKRIMVVEDLEVNQILINDILLPLNVKIVKCYNGKECFEKFFEIKDIDLILMDLDMPEMNGFESAKIIRSEDKVVPIIAQTAYSQKEDKERAKRVGFNDFITKPLKKDELIRVLLKFL